MATYTFNLNGQHVSVDCAGELHLLWVLRDLLGVHGPKYGCGLDVCKACTCHINGKTFNPCPVRVGDIQPTDRITTIEGLPATVEERLHPMQQAWLKYDVAQCGYCQPGQIMAAVALANEITAEGRQITDADLDSLGTSAAAAHTRASARPSSRRRPVCEMRSLALDQPDQRCPRTWRRCGTS